MMRKFSLRRIGILRQLRSSTETGTITSDVSVRMTSPSTVSPPGVIFDSVMVFSVSSPLSLLSVLSVLSVLVSVPGLVAVGRLRPDWALRTVGKTRRLNNIKTMALFIIGFLTDQGDRPAAQMPGRGLKFAAAAAIL